MSVAKLKLISRLVYFCDNNSQMIVDKEGVVPDSNTGDRKEHICTRMAIVLLI